MWPKAVGVQEHGGRPLGAALFTPAHLLIPQLFLTRTLRLATHSSPSSLTQPLRQTQQPQSSTRVPQFLRQHQEQTLPLPSRYSLLCFLTRQLLQTQTQPNRHLQQALQKPAQVWMRLLLGRCSQYLYQIQPRGPMRWLPALLSLGLLPKPLRQQTLLRRV